MLPVCLVVGVIIVAAIERSVILAHIDTVAAEIHARIAKLEENLKGKI